MKDETMTMIGKSLFGFQAALQQACVDAGVCQ